MDTDFIIDGENEREFEDDIASGRFATGLKPRLTQPGKLFCAKPFDLELIPENEVKSRILDRQQEQGSRRQFGEDAGIKVKFQDRLNFCWMFSGVSGLEYARAMAGLPHEILSPSSGACPVTGFRNVGNSMEAGLQRLVGKGVATVDYVPEVTLSNRDFRPGWEKNALKHRAEIFVDVMSKQDGEMDRRLTTLLLNDYVVPFGLYSMKHAMLYIDVVMIDENTIGYVVQNSWGTNWADRGFAIFPRGKGTADEGYGIARATITD